MNQDQKLLNRIAELEAQLAAVQQGVPAARSGRKVLVDSGALQMALNALERDALEGKLVRAEMRVELMQSITHPTQQGLEPCAPIRPKGMTSINARLAFNNGWVSCERHHGIRPADVGEALAMVAAQAKQGEQA